MAEIKSQGRVSYPPLFAKCVLAMSTIVERGSMRTWQFSINTAPLSVGMPPGRTVLAESASKNHSIGCGRSGR